MPLNQQSGCSRRGERRYKTKVQHARSRIVRRRKPGRETANTRAHQARRPRPPSLTRRHSATNAAPAWPAANVRSAHQLRPPRPLPPPTTNPRRSILAAPASTRIPSPPRRPQPRPHRSWRRRRRLQSPWHPRPRSPHVAAEAPVAAPVAAEFRSPPALQRRPPKFPRRRSRRNPNRAENPPAETPNASSIAGKVIHSGAFLSKAAPNRTDGRSAAGQPASPARRSAR